MRALCVITADEEEVMKRMERETQTSLVSHGGFLNSQSEECGLGTAPMECGPRGHDVVSRLHRSASPLEASHHIVLDNTKTTTTAAPEQRHRHDSALKPLPLFIALDLYQYA